MPVCPRCGRISAELGSQCPSDGFFFIPDDELEHARHDALLGTRVADKYVILGLINEGGMGAVYRALQVPVEREIALKVLRTELKDSDQGRQRFIREARAVSRLSHPNIITLFDFGFDEHEHPYMAMEYAPGGSLDAWMRRESVTTPRILHIIEQVLSALVDAHENGIVHRDLKPENMIILRSGLDHDFVKLLDFGIARLVNERTAKRLTREGEVFGTPHYMAPEQATGSENIGPPADVYAVGVMLFELITGRCPFDSDAPLTVLFMHLNEPLPEIVPRPGLDVSPELIEIVKRACAKSPSDRFQDASEMLAALLELRGIDASTSQEMAAPPTPAAPLNQTLEGDPSGEMAFAHTMMPDDLVPSMAEVVAAAPNGGAATELATSNEDDAWEEPAASGMARAVMVAAVMIVFVGLVGGAVAFMMAGADGEESDVAAAEAEASSPEAGEPVPAKPADAGTAEVVAREVADAGGDAKDAAGVASAGLEVDSAPDEAVDPAEVASDEPDPKEQKPRSRSRRKQARSDRTAAKVESDEAKPSTKVERPDKPAVAAPTATKSSGTGFKVERLDVVRKATKPKVEKPAGGPATRKLMKLE